MRGKYVFAGRIVRNQQSPVTAFVTGGAFTVTGYDQWLLRQRDDPGNVALFGYARCEDAVVVG